MGSNADREVLVQVDVGNKFAGKGVIARGDLSRIVRHIAAQRHDVLDIGIAVVSENLGNLGAGMALAC